MSLLAPTKRERKSNYSVDSYFKDTLRAGPAKLDKGPKVPRAPKQVTVYALPSVSYMRIAPTDSILGKISSSSLWNLLFCRSANLLCIRSISIHMGT